MSTAYRVYGNAGSGGPVDYTTVLQDSASTMFFMDSIAEGDWTLAVRAYDTVSGLEEQNTDAVISIIVGPGGADLTAVPNSPIGLTARATAGGGAVLDFVYVATGQAGAPTNFAAWLWPTGSVDWSDTPSATIAANLPVRSTSKAIRMTLTGLTDGASYQVGVRAVNAIGSDGNMVTFAVTGKASGPGAVVGLAGAPGYAGT